MAQWQHELNADQQWCQEAVDRLLARHGWQLIAPVEFAIRTCVHVRAGLTSDPTRAAIYTYCEVLYDACSGREGTSRRERAYMELHRWLYDIARQRYEKDAEELAQHAIVKVFTQFEHCRQPGAFLAFALQYVHDGARSQRRLHKREAVSLDPADESVSFGGEGHPHVQVRDMDERVTNTELHTRLTQLKADFIQKHPRAATQLDAVWLKYIAGLDDYAISDRLNKSVKRIHELRSLGLKKLRAEPQWCALAVDLGITIDA